MFELEATQKVTFKVYLIFPVLSRFLSTDQLAHLIACTRIELQYIYFVEYVCFQMMLHKQINFNISISLKFKSHVCLLIINFIALDKRLILLPNNAQKVASQLKEFAHHQHRPNIYIVIILVTRSFVFLKYFLQ